MKDIKQSFKTGLSFGLTSGVITTLGLMIGLHSGTHSKIAVLGGIFVIAVADAMSDALGMHISEESNGMRTQKEVWEATITTLISKFIVAIIFMIPVLIFPLQKAMVISVILGLILIGLLSFYITKMQNEKTFNVIFEHVLVTIIVVVVSHYVGDLAALIG